MNKEEKAIEWLKKADWFSARLYSPTILNLIEKQSKEIEELKAINQMQKYRIEVIDERELISKDKIKAKIEELERDKNKLYKEQGNIEEIKIYSVIDIIKAEILRFKELLEEE